MKIYIKQESSRRTHQTSFLIVRTIPYCIPSINSQKMHIPNVVPNATNEKKIDDFKRKKFAKFQTLKKVLFQSNRIVSIDQSKFRQSKTYFKKVRVKLRSSQVTFGYINTYFYLEIELKNRIRMHLPRHSEFPQKHSLNPAVRHLLTRPGETLRLSTQNTNTNPTQLPRGKIRSRCVRNHLKSNQIISTILSIFRLKKSKKCYAVNHWN